MGCQGATSLFIMICIRIAFAFIFFTFGSALPSQWVLTTASSTGGGELDLNGCWRDGYSRGLGQPATQCPDEQEVSASFCFIKCKEGYQGIGPYCLRITPNPDPDTSELPQRYYRGRGHLASCPSPSDQQGPLCFRPCDPNYEGIGPACLALNCPPHLPFPCGSLCTPSVQQCTEDVLTVAGKGYRALFKLMFGKPREGIEKVRELVKSLLALPVCHKQQEQEFSWW